MPASALLIRDRVADRFRDTGAVLLHGETQAGTAVTAAAVIATLDEFERLGALESGRTAAAALDAALTRWQSEDPAVLTTCGTGCFRAVVLADPVHGGPLGPVHVLPLVREIRRAGAQVHGGPNGVQLLPALTYSPAEIDELVSIVRDGVAAFSARVRREASAG